MSKIFIDTRNNLQVDDLVTLHVDCFPASRFSLLGAGFLRIYYESVIRGCTFVTARKKGEVIAFILGNTKTLNFFRILTLKLIIKCMIYILQNPKTIWSIIQALSERLTLKKLKCNEPEECSIELSHFAVSPLHQNIGIGTSLIEKFEEIARKNGFQYVHTRTHSQRLMQHYVDKKNATIIEYDARRSSYWILQWVLK